MIRRFSFAIAGLVFAANGLATGAQLEARDAPKIARLAELNRELATESSELARWVGRYANECPTAADRARRPCPGYLQNTTRSQARIRELGAQIRAVEKQLRELNHARGTEASLERARGLLRPGASAADLTEAVRCLRGLDSGYAGVSTLYDQAMTALRALDEGLATRLIRGFNERVCAPPDVISECWENLYGRQAYVTASGFRIDSLCLVRGTSSAWDHFPSDPEDYLKAARDVAAVVRPGGCHRRLNRETGADVATFLADRRPIITCSPSRPSDRDGECAHASKGSAEIVLTRPNACPNLGKTLFHELLHCESHTDNLASHKHNDITCRRYDAVYSCAELCFPTRDSIPMHKAGCEACAVDRPSVCRGKADDYDDRYFRCGVMR